MKLLTLILLSFMLSSCEESIEPKRVEGEAQKPFEKNATDAVGVAEGDKQVSPFGKPAH